MKSYTDYFYPGTETLKNNFGIRDPIELESAEALLTRFRIRQWEGPFSFTPEGLRELHHHIFQDIYPFAGEFRSVSMEKVRADGENVRFTPGSHVQLSMVRLFGELGVDLYSKDGFDRPGKEDFAYRAAVYIADLNYIHPFPEGNGRVQRIFLSELAKHSGYEVDIISMDRQSWISASVESFDQVIYDAKGRVIDHGEHAQMRALITDATQPTAPTLSPREQALVDRLVEDIRSGDHAPKTMPDREQDRDDDRDR